MDRFEQLVAARAPWWAARPTQIYWSTLGMFERRLARSFGNGGVWLAGDSAHQAAPVGVHSMNSGLIEARELAVRLSRIHYPAGPSSLLEGFAADTHKAWLSLLGDGEKARALPAADPWVRQNRARIVACVPASGDDLEPLLGQIGLTVAPLGRDTA